MTLLNEQYAFRSGLVDRLERDLIGPAGGSEEVISDPPITRYIAGILYPPSAGGIDAAEDLDDSAVDSEGPDDFGVDDPPVALANIRYPSSMGLTFAVDGAAAEILVEVTAARYVPLEDSSETEKSESQDEAELQRGRRSASRARQEPAWKRRCVSAEPVHLSLNQPTHGARTQLADGLTLFHRIRPADAVGHVAVTLILINTVEPPSTFGRDAYSWFQPEIRVSTPPQFGANIVHRPGAEPPEWDADIRSYRLLYRHCTSMGTGHGCSLTWETNPADPTRTAELRTTFLPRFELLLADSNPAIPTDSLGMKAMARGSRGDSLGGLRALCDGYEEWIGSQSTQVESLPDDFRRTANEHVISCRQALERMRRGVELLASDDSAWLAFQLANEAMLMQRARSVWLDSGAPEGGPILDDAHRWRPFQIAFILLCLEGIVDESSDGRDLADLLWFPTGGGKTEAYLGLLAFTVLLRRLRDPTKGHGVTVVMRYTLRLLTIQQFERAALLVCSLESIRRGRDDLGSEPISIGLWVGRGATPNNLAEARRSLDKLRKGAVLAESNPMQLQRCPWCGTPLDARSLYIAKAPARLVMACDTDSCEFRRGLPVAVVDDDIYSQHPTLIIATADKFASLPWNDSCGSLFNLDLLGVAPPELIIQDELHLISGPLGTLAGLYESAIDLLCTAEGVRPKVVASTATIRRAGQQTAGLFNRQVRQFPPPATDGRDSYFAVEAPRDERGTRMYVGCMAPGTSQTTLMVRVYASLLQSTNDEAGSDAARDPYWTLVGYFNSLRVLGGARMQVQDDVNDRLELLANSSNNAKRLIENRIELTSREPSGDIPDHLRRMATPLPDEAALDVILATNMISVGVDIDRLGLMVVMGQPQSTSEYIQATSRVGRRHPGLVIVMFNASKSRDRSHYESFVDYHSALYRQVESSSVTPFSPRARDRALHAVLIALARLTIPGLRDNKAARDIRKVEPEVRRLAQSLVLRARDVDPREASTTEDELNEIIDDWIERADEERDLVFRNANHPDLALLGDASIPEDELQGALPTLWSLRDVDQSSNLYQVQ